MHIQDRLEIILDNWIELGHVPSPAEVSKEESIDFLWSKGGFLCVLSASLCFALIYHRISAYHA